MGQGHSSSDGKEVPLAYHPSAVGNSLNNRKRQASGDGVFTKRSLIGPIRNRVKGKQDLSMTPDEIDEDQTAAIFSEQEPRSMPDEIQNAVEEVQSPASFYDMPPSQAFSSPSQVSPNVSTRGDHRISAIPTHPSIVELPELEAIDSREQSDIPPVPTLSLPIDDSSHLEISDRGHTPEPIPSHLADALKSGLGRKYLSIDTNSSIASSHAGNHETSHLRTTTDEANRDTLLAYWERAESENLQRHSLVSSDRSFRRHSWNSSGPEGGSEHSASRAASPYRTVAGRWTSQWEDRRGLGISESESLPSQMQLHWSSSDGTPPQTEVSPSPGKIRRKPVPSQEDFDHLAMSHKVAPVEVGKQHVLWPATVEEPEEVLSQRNSHISRASATTDALHSHVEKLRAGPSFQIDPSASSLFIPTEVAHIAIDSSHSNSNDQNNNETAAAQGNLNSPVRKRARALSLMAKIKSRVRKTSESTIVSPSTPGLSITSSLTPRTPAQPLADQVLLINESVQRMMQSPPSQHSSPPVIAEQASRSLYDLARRPSKKSKGIEESPELGMANSGSVKRVMRRPTSSLSGRSSRQSIRSVNSAKSNRSKRSTNANLKDVDNSVNKRTTQNKHRSNSQPLSGQQQWWKSHVVWPRRGSGAGLLSKDQTDEDENAWVDDEEVNEDDRGIISPVPRTIGRDNKSTERTSLGWNLMKKSPSLGTPTNTELITASKEEKHNNVYTGKDSPPLALIGQIDEELRQLDHQHGLTSVKTTSSASTFSSLAPLPPPAPVPPPRPSRKTRRADSSSNGEDSSSPTSPHLSSFGKDGLESESGSGSRVAKTGRFSPLSLGGGEPESSKIVAGMAAFVPATSPSPTFNSPRVSKTISDADTKEILLSEESEDHRETDDPENELFGDEADYNATVQPYLNSITTIGTSKPRPVTLSPVKELRKREIAALQEEEEEDEDGEEDSFTVTEQSDAGTSHIRVPSLARSERGGASMGLPSSLAFEASPQKRPLPAPPVLAEPTANLHTVTRSNSIGSSQAGSTIGGQASVASMTKHTGEGGNTVTVARRPLPPTPSMTTNTRTNRSVSMPSKPTPPNSRATYEIVQAIDAGQPSSVSQEGERKRTSKIRESWTSADGPWHADIVALPSELKSQPVARGLARPAYESKEILSRQRSSSSPLDAHMIKRGDWTEKEKAEDDIVDDAMAFEPVPFPETAVQASLAALNALEQSDQGNDWRSRWAREKLMGSSGVAAPSIRSKVDTTVAPSIQLQPSISEMSDYSNSRSRRRAAPYSRSKDEMTTSSADERARRSARKKQSDRSHHRLLAVQAESMINSDSDQAVYNYTTRGAESIRTTTLGNEGRKGSTTSRQGRNKKYQRAQIPSFTNSQPEATLEEKGEEDWDEKVVPALARRLQMEAEQEAKMLSSNSGGGASPAPAVNNIGNSSLPRPEKTSIDSLVEHKDVRQNPQHRVAATEERREHESKKRASKYTKAEEEDSEDAKTSRSRRDRRRVVEKESKKKKPSSSSTSMHRIRKIRRGYGCDDIKAWQASLGGAATPATLVE